MKHFLIALMLLATPALAVQPGEMLEDLALEDRARDLSKGLRCLVCRNESIDESNAELARDLRILVRERLLAGDTDAEVISFLVDRYGEYVLLKPQLNGSNLILWIAGPAMLFGALGIGLTYVRGRKEKEPDEGLSEADEQRLADLMKDDQSS